MAMSVGRIHYLAYALWIGAVTLALLSLVAILPGPFWLLLGVLLYALGSGMILLRHLLRTHRQEEEGSSRG